MLKKLYYIIFILLLFQNFLFAGISRTLFQQGLLTDANGIPLNTTIKLTFRLYDSESSGNLLWTESYNSVNIINGIYNVYLGTSTPLDNLVFDREYWLSIEVNDDGEMLPRIKLVPSPYSIRSIYSDTAASLADNAFVKNLTVNGTVSASSFVGNGSGLTGISLKGSNPWSITEDTLIFYNKGQVVIGKQTPISNAILSLSSDMAYQYLLENRQVAGEYATTEKNWDGNLQIFSNINASPSRDIRLLVNGSGYGEVMRLTSDKKVGIGTSKPGANLELSSSGVPEFRIRSTDNSKHGKITFYNNTTQIGVIQGMPVNSTYGSERSQDMEYLVNYGDHTFWNKTSRLLTIKNNGNVGIGTFFPNVSLHIFKADLPWVKTEWTNPASYGGHIFYENNTNKGQIHIIGSAYYEEYRRNDLEIASIYGDVTLKPGNKNVLTAMVNGNVGIGTTSPVSKLEVAGTVKSSGIINTGYVTQAFSAKTADYTVTDSDNIVAVDASSAAVTITLPSAVGIAGREYTIKKTDNINNVIVACNGTETIDGNENYTLSNQWGFVKVISNGANWLIIGRY